MDAELRYNLFLALKEALNNVVKHAHATEVRLELRLEKDSFTLAVQDDGHGMPGTAHERKDVLVTKAADREFPGSNGGGNGERIVFGHGLHNLEKRLRSVGGQCLILSGNGDGNGTRVEMTVQMKGTASPIMAIAGNGHGKAQ